MIHLTEPETITAPNAWGQDSTFTRQKFQIENYDIKPHYLGHDHASAQVKPGDIIIVHNKGGAYESWHFDPNMDSTERYYRMR